MKPAILVVDDDKKTVDLIRLYLEKDGYRVLVAYDGRRAIDIARNRRPGRGTHLFPGKGGSDRPFSCHHRRPGWQVS